MSYADLTEDQLTRDLAYARARLYAAGEWLERAEQARLTADHAARQANGALDLDDNTPGSAAAAVAAIAASAGLHAAYEVHRKAAEEIAEWQARVSELDEALDIKCGGAGDQL